MSAACPYLHRAVELRTGGARVLRVMACRHCGALIGPPIGVADSIEKRPLKSRRIDRANASHSASHRAPIVATRGQRGAPVPDATSLAKSRLGRLARTGGAQR